MDMVHQQVEQGQNILEKEQTKPDHTEIKKGVNYVYQQMQLILLTEQATASGLQSKLDKMRTQIAEAKTGSRRLTRWRTRRPTWKEKSSCWQTSYGQYFTKLEEARIDQALKSDRITNISHFAGGHAARPPVGPGKTLRLGLGLLLAIAGGIAFAFLCEYLDHSIKTPEDVHEKLQLPTLASIPQARANTVGPVWKSSLWKRFGIKPRQTAPVQWDIPANMRRHYAVFREQLLLSCQRVSARPQCHRSHELLRCEGVSTVAANLASSLSEQGSGAILLVDANTHNPSVHRIFRTRQSPGLTDILRPDSKCAETTPSCTGPRT